MSKNDCKDTTTQQDGRITPAKAAAVDSLIDARVIEDIPVELANNLTLLSRKLTAFLAYYSAASLTRLNTLNRFIQDAENKLYIYSSSSLISCFPIHIGATLSTKSQLLIYCV